MEKKADAREDGPVLPHPWLFLLAVGLALVIVDPFHWGPLGGRDFRPVKTQLAPYHQVMEQWPGDRRSRLRLGRLEFVDQVFGPESLEFDGQGRGPYAGLADGRIVRWMGETAGWETFALVSPNWSEKVCANGVESTTRKQHRLEHLCGRPLGLRFDKRTGDLYVADAYFGLAVVQRNGGAATLLSTHVEGRAILFANDLDVHRNGSIFFTDTSTRFSRRDHYFILLEGEATGRLLRYDPETRSTHVVLRGLAFANGVQLSKDQTFLLLTETTNCRIMRYWIEGPRSGELEVFANLPGFPDNIRMGDSGRFWVAVDCCRTRAQELLSHHPWLRAIYFRLPLRLRFLAGMTGMRMFTTIALLDEDGTVVEVLEDRGGEVMKLVSEVRQAHGKLWIGSVAHNSIGTLPYPGIERVAEEMQFMRFLDLYLVSKLSKYY